MNHKNNIVVIGGLLALHTCMVSIATYFACKGRLRHERIIYRERKELPPESLKTTNLGALIDAFIYVESKGDIKARNGQYVGCIQIAPVMIDEANRILGMNKYTLDDRTDKKKSIEIFMVVQEYYNPEYDLHKACKVWNPTSSMAYHDKVERKYKELMSQRQRKGSN